jgi:anti-sigma factor RsiW
VTIREKQLLAWLDGELDEAGAEAVEQAIQADPELMARAESHFLTMMQLRGAFAPLLDAPLPEPPAVTTRSDEEVAEAEADESTFEESAADARSDAPPSRGIRSHVAALGRPSLRRWGLFAAALLLGVLIGRFVLGSSAPVTVSRIVASASGEGDIVRDQGGSLIAAGTLADALENGLAPGDEEPVHIPLSFRDKTGRLCRSFDTARLAGIACRDDDGWRLRLALQTGSGGRSAASESPFVGQAVDAMIAGEPLDAGQQQAAKDRGWR